MGPEKHRNLDKHHCWSKVMRKQFSALVKTFVRDERGASLLEYTILIGLISAAAVVAVTTIGGWVSDQWDTLQTNLDL